jgi:hypothetical protein
MQILMAYAGTIKSSNSMHHEMFVWWCLMPLSTIFQWMNKGNNKITELRTILQRESQNS